MNFSGMTPQQAALAIVNSVPLRHRALRAAIVEACEHFSAVGMAASVAVLLAAAEQRRNHDELARKSHRRLVLATCAAIGFAVLSAALWVSR